MKHDIGRPLRSHRVLSMAGLLAVMAVIFVADTVTDYAVAAAGFYTAVILVAVRLISARALIILAGLCIFLTILSFGLTKFGSYQVGLINSCISIIAIAITTYLALKMNAAQAAAQQAQAQLLRIARVTSLGELTTSIAHEVNQPLAAIATSGNACQRWLDQQPPNLDKARQAVERILGDAHRASDIIARVRGLTRGELPHKSHFDLNQAVLEVLAISRSDVEAHGIVIAVSLDENLPLVVADRVQIQQVIVNMMLNASEAMAANPDKKKEMKILSARRDAQTVQFTLVDSGSGFATGTMAQMFDPFWTTKGSGIGLGLAISRTIIEANGGRIWAEQNPDGGAIFQFSLLSAKENTL
ncbi:two-component sensor histidine kinase [Herminiimonas sp. KBW02]|uniref:sensor histidine kinase n=1 Tax=Herminiimonas sp. KBW02 TaxID=2153363 RepID=UPI000F5A60AB|nr:ATP-binding protein [Herminiimonas sp. KBW02]RQO35783.1 two-component sensor histidine kinase [Herminiimonas sp. KBW02]